MSIVEKLLPEKWSVLRALIVVVVLAMPRAADAVIIKLTYIPTNAPACCTNNLQMTRQILQVAREWEAHSYGSVKFDWIGISNALLPNRPNDMIQVWWNPGLINSPGNCANMWPPNHGSAGMLELNPNEPWAFNSNAGGTTWRFPDSAFCRDFRGTLLHEMTHFFRNEPNHPVESVLTATTTWWQLFNRHLWNSDIGGIATQFFPHQPVGASHDVL